MDTIGLYDKVEEPTKEFKRPDPNTQIKSVFDDVNLSQKREDDESFDDYKQRMKDTKKLLKQHRKGYLRWNSASLVYNPAKRRYDKVIQQGTYRVGL